MPCNPTLKASCQTAACSCSNICPFSLSAVVFAISPQTSYVNTFPHPPPPPNDLQLNHLNIHQSEHPGDAWAHRREGQRSADFMYSGCFLWLGGAASRSAAAASERRTAMMSTPSLSSRASPRASFLCVPVQRRRRQSPRLYPGLTCELKKVSQSFASKLNIWDQSSGSHYIFYMCDAITENV